MSNKSKVPKLCNTARSRFKLLINSVLYSEVICLAQCAKVKVKAVRMVLKVTK